MRGLGPVIVADRKLIEAELRKALRFGKDVPARLSRAMRYAALGPGKRVRPMLALEAFRAAGGRNLEAVLPFCAGIELIHTFSLIHDDLPSMDDDDFRRGRPSLHRKFDEATAILAADGLFAYAFELFVQAPGPAERKLAAIRVICRAVGPAGMTGGQMMDIAGKSKVQRAKSGKGKWQSPVIRHFPFPLSPFPFLEIQRKKTAEFIAAAVVGGAILGGAAVAAQRKLRQAGLALGRLFQITDDLLDSEQASEAGRATMVSTCGRARTTSRAESEARRSERLFNGMGVSYRLLAAFPGLVLRRKS